MAEEMSPELEKEYDEVFSGEEKSWHLVKLDSSKFKRERKFISVKSIGLTEPIKVGRGDTVTGLTSSIKEMGVTTPIHVMALEKPDEDGAVSYQLLDGLRRLYGARRNGFEDIEAIVWDFEDKLHSKQVSLALSLLLNRTQRRSWKEIWDLYQILELQMDITPGTLEYLLQMEAGDAMKLKDVMLSGYQEVVDDLMDNRPLEMCYAKLKKLRKMEDALAKDDATQLRGNVEGANDVLGSGTQSRDLSDEEVRSLLEMAKGVIDDDTLPSESVEDLDRTQEIRGVEFQDVNDRHIIDPVIKQATLIRDEFKCRCCGKGGAQWLGILVFHHLVPVSAHGPDTVDNGLTLCSDCHITLHLYVAGNLSVDYKSLSDGEQTVFSLIFRYGNIAIESYKRMKMDRQEIRHADAPSRRHLFPGEGLDVNRQAYTRWQSKSS